MLLEIFIILKLNKIYIDRISEGYKIEYAFASYFPPIFKQKNLAIFHTEISEIAEPFVYGIAGKVFL